VLIPAAISSAVPLHAAIERHRTTSPRLMAPGELARDTPSTGYALHGLSPAPMTAEEQHHTSDITPPGPVSLNVIIGAKLFWRRRVVCFC
jgi:hypothetical protein